MTSARAGIIGLLTLLATTGAINAGAAGEVVLNSEGYTQVAVPYSDLDLSQPSDAAAMLSRLHSAARKVCSRTYSETEMSTRALYRSCEKQAMETGVSAVHSSVVANAFRAPQVPAAETDSRLGLK